jgi:transposase InsO family protein
MNPFRSIGLGTRLMLDGELYQVSAIDGSHVTLTGPSGGTALYQLRELAAQARVVDVAEPPQEVTGPLLASLPKHQREALESRLRHVREVLTGFADEHPADDAVPREGYSTERSRGKRQAMKAAELGVSKRTVRGWCDRYEHGGPAALVDQRTIRGMNPLRGIDLRWIEACHEVLAEHINASRPTQALLLERIERRARVKYNEVDDPIRIPGRGKARVALRELTRGTNALNGSTKAKRSIANRPAAPYGTLTATHPGEYVLADTTPLDVFAMEPVTLRWVSVELTIALDLYSRVVPSIRLTPVSTKADDVRLLMYDMIGAPDPVHPLAVIARTDINADPPVPRSQLPLICPGTLIIDHGKIYLSDQTRSLCQRLGISVQPGRPYTPTDKAAVERFFRTLREELLVALPGYKGPDIHSRGKDIEERGFYFIPELEALIRDWVNNVYHRSPHDGLVDPAVPGLRYTPLQQYEAGIARAGFVRLPGDPNLALDFLPVEWRTVQHYGVEVDGLRYDGPGLDAARKRTSPYGGVHRGKWPIRIDPGNRQRVFFHDESTGQWHSLWWRHHREVPQPFSTEVLRYARQIARTAHQVPDDRRALKELLERWDAGNHADSRERRMWLRLSELTPTDLPPDVDTPPERPGRILEVPTEAGDDDIDEELDDFYAQALEVDE